VFKNHKRNERGNWFDGIVEAEQLNHAGYNKKEGSSMGFGLYRKSLVDERDWEKVKFGIWVHQTKQCWEFPI